MSPMQPTVFFIISNIGRGYTLSILCVFCSNKSMLGWLPGTISYNQFAECAIYTSIASDNSLIYIMMSFKCLHK